MSKANEHGAALHPPRRALVILPTYNEALNIEPLLAQLRQLPLHLLFIDDHSTDGTAEILRGAAAAAPDRIWLIERPGKLGYGTAYVAGFRWALARDYERILGMDADFSHDPADIPRLLRAAETHDLVIGSRYVGGIRILNWPLRRLALSTAAAHYVRLVTRLPVCDPTSGFKCFRREVVEALNLEQLRANGYAFQVELNYRVWMLGYALTEVPIIFTERSAGQSKLSAGIVFEAVWRTGKLALQHLVRGRPKQRSRP
ncbi:MAG: polyprenol monophosphomannose synthase [Pyrinomonadaceae bacterium]